MKIGFCTGVFDRFHRGHEHFLNQAALRCDHLIVAVNRDAWCRRKGVDRPFDDLATRMRWVRLHIWGLGMQEAVIPFAGNDLALAAEIKPDVIFRGWDQRIDSWSEIDTTIPVVSGTIPVIRIGQLPGVSTTLLASQKEPT